MPSFTAGFFRVTIFFLSRPAPVNLQRFSIKAVFLKNVSILLAKQSLRTSKMATRNTSSSVALLDGSPAYLVCDWPAAATAVLLFAETRCLSRDASFTTSRRAPAMIGRLGKVKGQTQFFLNCFIESFFFLTLSGMVYNRVNDV